MLIREATPADAPDLTRARQDAWRAAYRGIVPDAVLDGLDHEKEANRWRERLSPPPPGASGGTVPTPPPKNFVAELDGRVVGFCGGGPCRDEDLEYDGELYAIYIHPRWHGQGIGRALLERMARWLRWLGCRRMLIWVLEDNAPARRFYESLGGQLARRRSIEIGGAVLPEVAYGYNLEGYGPEQ
jgi:hypothetical protein